MHLIIIMTFADHHHDDDQMYVKEELRLPFFNFNFLTTVDIILIISPIAYLYVKKTIS